MHESWSSVLDDELAKPYFSDLLKFVATERETNKVYPPKGKVFTAFDVVPFDKVRVVILGQDPYPSPGHAHGMSFSVPPGVRPPKSLVNIYKELQTDLGIKPVGHGYLMPWAEQGVFMLNTVLTVRDGEPGSHRGKGWEKFTNRVIKLLSVREGRIVFLLWGRDAQSFAPMINTSEHKILISAHPSPLSAHQGFFGSKPFSQTNDALVKKGFAPIDWDLSKQHSVEGSHAK
jgi:uracil-DNA glycosylase